MHRHRERGERRARELVYPDTCESCLNIVYVEQTTPNLTRVYLRYKYLLYQLYEIEII